ncbi:hypothetical protein PV396_13925 [Streptomyces sp. ME02-8801-2C]|uniref:hypothetical protein n=1 Tax=Streptomyces sp. ME02-8801-2C TaxID=3028680 RepID=UPI0029BF030A|nr:hypothetical protein [Streptomyces sp. ME02-8801-2C]MDX3453037.1 hypothetical protein [Streptomyces sp. ME02-8801-2C]
MPRNLAELARAALTARDRQGADGPYTMRTRLDSGAEVSVADICMRDDLGFVLLFHRRKDGHFAEELYFSTRLDDGSWAAADHLSGGAMGIEPTSPRDLASVLDGRSLVPFGESETLLLTGRPEADEGYELLRFYELLVDGGVDHLDIENTAPEAGPTRDPIQKSLISQVALFALFPGERVTVRAMAGKGPGSHPLGEPYELTGPGA